MKKTTQCGFPPIADGNSRILILGSFPGTDSLKEQQYYAHSRNKFWTIMAELCSFDMALGYEEKDQKLKDSGIAVWDVLRSCEREGASDNKIRNPEPNDFTHFFTQYGQVKKVFFNGRKAESLYRQLVAGQIEGDNREYCYLPSTSPANAGISFEQKLAAWRAITDQ